MWFLVFDVVYFIIKEKRESENRTFIAYELLEKQRQYENKIRKQPNFKLTLFFAEGQKKENKDISREVQGDAFTPRNPMILQ